MVMDMDMDRERMYSFDEIGLIPEAISFVKSRKDVVPYMADGKLPIFVSPMTCIIGRRNVGRYDDSLFVPVLPVECGRNDVMSYDGWVAVTVSEFKDLFCNPPFVSDGHHKVLIDCADGHMHCLYEMVKAAKALWGDALEVMLGNIANPKAYVWCCDAGVDWVRVGIGGGNGCTTSVQTGFHASMPWLLDGINAIRKERMMDGYFCTKVIADGGIDRTDKFVKALALGADAVMMGSEFARCSDIDDVVVTEREYYGQSSYRGQMDRFGYVKGASEGMSKMIAVDTDLTALSKRYECALRSAMSYAGAFELSDFVGMVEWCPMTISEFNSYNKKVE